MNPLSPARAGISMAASWSWGASLGVGIAVLHTAGWQAFLIWSVMNILAIPFFGYLYTRLDSYKHIIELRPMIAFMFLLQGFALLINQQLLFEGLAGGVDIDIMPVVSESVAIAAGIIVAIGLIIFINKTLLMGSLKTDLGQYTLQVIGVVLLIAVSIQQGDTTINAQIGASTVSDIQWAIWVGLGLLAGPSMDAMQFQRIEQVTPTERFKATLYGGVFFGMYLSLVGVAGLFISSNSLLVSLAFLIVVLSITTSTIDSASAAMHRLAPKKVATGVALAIAVSWPLLIEIGVTGIFTIYSSGRVFVVSGVLVFLYALHLTGRHITNYTGGEDPGNSDKATQAVGTDVWGADD